MLLALLASLLSIPLHAEGGAAFTAALTLDDEGLLRVVETVRPIGALGTLCGPFARELPAKRLRLDGLRRLVAVRVKGFFRGSGLSFAPAKWTLKRSPRGARLTAPPAAGLDCAVTLSYETEPLLAVGPGGTHLRFPLPGGELGAALARGTVSLGGSLVPVRLTLAGSESPLAEGIGSVIIPEGLKEGAKVVFVADLENALPPPPASGGRRLLADNLHIAAGTAGLVLLLVLYAALPAPDSHDGRPWSLLAAGGALSAGTVAAMRLLEDPASIGPSAAAWALAAGAGAAIAGALTLAFWGLTLLLLRSASRSGAPRPAVLSLAASACAFVSFGVTTFAADVLTRLVHDAAPAVVACQMAHLLTHAAAFILKRHRPSNS